MVSVRRRCTCILNATQSSSSLSRSLLLHASLTQSKAIRDEVMEGFFSGECAVCGKWLEETEPSAIKGNTEAFPTIA